MADNTNQTQPSQPQSQPQPQNTPAVPALNPQSANKPPEINLSNHFKWGEPTIQKSTVPPQQNVNLSNTIKEMVENPSKK